MQEAADWLVVLAEVDRQHNGMGTYLLPNHPIEIWSKENERNAVWFWDSVAPYRPM